MIIDFHTHAFPDPIAPRAMQALSFAAGGLKPQTEGTVSSLKEQLKGDDVHLGVVLSIATNPAQQKKVNDFAIAVNQDPMLFAFGSVHPDAEDALFSGAVHCLRQPDYLSAAVSDRKMVLLDSCGAYGVSDAGGYRDFCSVDCACKPDLRKTLSAEADFGNLWRSKA